MPSSLQDQAFLELKRALPDVFCEAFTHDDPVIARAYPLLTMICNNQALLQQVRLTLNLPIPAPIKGATYPTQIQALCEKLETNFNRDALFKYRLPVMLGEFPIHTRVINQAIKAFNQLIEQYHQEASHTLDGEQLEENYLALLTTIKEHGATCDIESLWQLLHLLSGFCIESPEHFFIVRDSAEAVDLEPNPPSETKDKKPVVITELAHPTESLSARIFVQNYDYNFNRAGRLASETDTLLLNAFGMKIGGHFDAQVKYPPKLIPINLLHAMIQRQLSHRMEIPQGIAFKLWIELTLHALGMRRIQQTEEDETSETFINPFLAEPISALNPQKIEATLKASLLQLSEETLSPTPSDLEVLSCYLFEFLQGFQTNPGQALGIGANWDGTINMSNESGAYPFKLHESEVLWGKRFKQLSLHRQGPSEAYMNAATGINYEIQGFLTDFDYMTQLQASEHREVLYNALIDNLVSDLFPEPAYFENQHYKKYRKQHVVQRNSQGDIRVDSFYQLSNHGTYFKDKAGKEKQTPLYRRAGTLDVQAFPRNTTYSENSRASYAGNPLGPLQLQYAQSMHQVARGHIAYDPICPDQFIPDSFHGQVMLSHNGDVLPFIGVIPKNFDKHFKQDKELCASFVIRMLQSSRIREYSPTFRDAYEQIKTRFLPSHEAAIPALPPLALSHHIVTQYEQLTQLLSEEQRTFSSCEHTFYSLYKNLIYSLYEFGREDENFVRYFITLINAREIFYPITKATCESIIRDLTVNRPVGSLPAALAHYDEMLHFLRDLTLYFYPTPSDELATEIAYQAKLHIEPLFQSEAIQTYFESLQGSTQANLSRRQSPGMLYAALKHHAPSQTIVSDYTRMHQENFPSYFRDPEGASFGEPQPSEKMMDWGAKWVGAVAQLIHKYHLFSVISQPFSKSYTEALQMTVKHRRLKPLWAILGGLKGFFLDGLAVGLWQTTMTPFLMIKDLGSFGYHAFKKKKNISLNNPLAISAAPLNEPSLKVKTITASRDYILQLLSTAPQKDNKKIKVVSHATALLKLLYPQLTHEDIHRCELQLNSAFPLNEDEMAQLFNPFKDLFEKDDIEEPLQADDIEIKPLFSSAIEDKFVGLAACLNKHTAIINQDVIHAVFKCLINTAFLHHSNTVIKEAQSFFSLNSKQHRALTELLNLYRDISNHDDKQAFVRLFQFRGTIHLALQRRDQHIQTIQSWLSPLFDKEWVLDLLFDHQIETVTSALTPHNLKDITSKLPLRIKRPLLELLQSQDSSILQHYTFTRQQENFVVTVCAMFNQITDERAREAIIHHCSVENIEDSVTVSARDSAQNKWSAFAKRELKHQLLAHTDVNALFKILDDNLKQSADFINKLQMLKRRYLLLDNQFKTAPNSCDGQALNEFYMTACCIQNRLAEHINSCKKSDSASYEEAQTLLGHFIDVTMNAMVNSWLDAVDLFAEELTNPFMKSAAIESWLIQLKEKNHDLRSLLEQQIQQSPSLDHALWRHNCIFQVLEKSSPTQRITKTGTQALLRFWAQHRDNRTNTGDVYRDPKTGEPYKSTAAILTNGSITMQYALERVREKLAFSVILR